MKGKILDYTIQESQGVISGNDGKRYTFDNTAWKGGIVPAKGQIVDFEINNNTAKDIYPDSSTMLLNTEQIKTAMNSIKDSQIVKKTLESGVQNKFGFTLSIMMLVGLFLPILEIPFMGSVNLFDGSKGKLLFIMLLLLGYLFYTGAKHAVTKIATSIIVAIIFVQFYDLLTVMNNTESMFGAHRRDTNLFGLLGFGMPVNIFLAFLLLYAGMRKKYKVNI